MGTVRGSESHEVQVAVGLCHCRHRQGGRAPSPGETAPAGLQLKTSATPRHASKPAKTDPPRAF